MKRESEYVTSIYEHHHHHDELAFVVSKFRRRQVLAPGVVGGWMKLLFYLHLTDDTIGKVFSISHFAFFERG